MSNDKVKEAQMKAEQIMNLTAMYAPYIFAERKEVVQVGSMLSGQPPQTALQVHTPESAAAAALDLACAVVAVCEQFVKENSEAH